ncbi:hypothetical protein CYY_003897 [Polysphondylium violaceum]|uniref:Uncharacterized protein n=1 Tax=Polysphondylium violaceum TaxID=133409 RepID=A0A8J4PXS5_9MYCE|nr:hypothetical protein CYY_003897 [Polysphondylium violaceum]
MIPNTIQKKIITDYWIESKEESKSLIDADVSKQIIKHYLKSRLELALVSKYWFQQISILFSFNHRATSLCIDQFRFHEKIDNPFSLLSYSSQHSLSYIQSFQNDGACNKLEIPDSLNARFKDPNNNNNSSSFNLELYFSNLKCIKFIFFSLINDGVISIIELISKCNPSLNEFSIYCSWPDLKYLNSCQDSLLKMGGVTHFEINCAVGYKQTWDTNIEKEFCDQLYTFLKCHSNTLHTFTIQGNDVDLDLPLFCNTLPLIKDKVKVVNYENNSHIIENHTIEDTSLLFNTLNNIKQLDDYNLIFLSKKQNTALLTKNNISSFENGSPLSIVSTTRSKEFNVKLHKLQKPLVYSGSIKCLNISSKRGKVVGIDHINFALDPIHSHTGLDFLRIRHQIDIQVLSTFILSNPPIKHLLIDFNISLEKDICFLDAVSRNTSLTSIKITFEKDTMDRPDYSHLVSCIVQNKTLCFIILCGVSMDLVNNTLSSSFSIGQYQSRIVLKRF